MAVTISLAITQNSQSVANNTSNVTVKATVKWTGGDNNVTGQCTGSITIDGTKYSFSGLKFNTGKTTSGSQVIMTKTVNVTHKTDGTKTLNCSTSFVTGVSSGTISASASKALTTIPRKSTLTASNGTLGTAQTLTINRNSSSFTHTITYFCGSASGTIATKTTSTSISFTPPLSLASQNTTGTSVSVKFTIATYSGSTSLGSNTKTITCSIPSSVKPSCKITVSDAAGYSVYVKGYSKFKITVTPTTSYGSAIASYSVNANGTTYTTASVTTSVLASSGTLTITATVKDKRGRTGTATKTVTVYDKSTLVVSNGTLGILNFLTIVKNHSDFTHTITYTCGSTSGTIARKTTEEAAVFIPPLSLASQNTTGTSISVKITLTTYCDDKSIGTNTKTITCSMPSSVKPSVSVDWTDTSGVFEKYGCLVKGLSTLHIDLVSTAAYGADIVSYNTVASGKKFTTDSFDLGSVSSLNNVQISATVTDTRGRKGTADVEISDVLDYSKPVVSKLSVRRCNENGTANDDGAFAKVSYASSVAPLNNLNESTVVLKYKKTTESSFQTGETTKLTDVFSLSKDFIFPADTGSSYNIMLTVEDSHSKVSKSTSVSTGVTIMHFHESGKGMAVGKVSEKEGFFDVGFKTQLRDHCFVDNKKIIYGIKPDGSERSVFVPQNENGNTVIGHGNYLNEDGITYLDGHDIQFAVSNVAAATTWKPYRRQGDSLTMTLKTTGMVLASGKEVTFRIPLTVPIIGSPVVTVTSGSGFILFQNGQYTHGSGTNTYVTPVSYATSYGTFTGITVVATFEDTTNAITRAPTAFWWNGTITFS